MNGIKQDAEIKASKHKRSSSLGHFRNGSLMKQLCSMFQKTSEPQKVPFEDPLPAKQDDLKTEARLVRVDCYWATDDLLYMEAGQREAEISTPIYVKDAMEGIIQNLKEQNLLGSLSSIPPESVPMPRLDAQRNCAEYEPLRSPISPDSPCYTPPASKGEHLLQHCGMGHQKRPSVIRFERFTCLLESVAAGDLDEVKRLVDEAEPKKLFLSMCNADGATAIHYAAGHGYRDVVEYLLEMEAEINVPNGEGWTPLHFAAFINSVLICELLVSRGADIQAKDSLGKTPLDLATDIELIRDFGRYWKHKQMAQVLIAIYDFDAEETDELSFKRKDRLYILERHEDGWWKAQLLPDGAIGFIPMQFVQ